VSDPGRQRLRLRFTKHGKVRFTSHRDVARMWERALRRSGLPLAWSEGFSPHLLLSFGLALPTGCESDAEYLDAVLELPEASEGPGPETTAPGRSPGELATELSALLPGGIDVTAAAWLAHGAVSLQQEVTSCSWELEVHGVTATDLGTRVERLLDAPSVPIRRERKGRVVADDLRPSVLALTHVSPEAGSADPETAGEPTRRLRADLSTQPRGVRPAELLAGLGTGLELVRARRTHQWIERDGARWEPLPLAGGGPAEAPAERAPERAS